MPKRTKTATPKIVAARFDRVQARSNDGYAVYATRSSADKCVRISCNDPDNGTGSVVLSDECVVAFADTLKKLVRKRA